MNFKLLAVAAASLASSAAMAVSPPSTSWGVHDPVEVASPTVAPNAWFGDFFTFSIPTLSSLASTAVAANVSITMPAMDILKITGGTYSLWMDPDGTLGNGDESTMGAWAWGFSGTTGSVTNQVANLAAGNYYYAVSGYASGVAGGQYTLVSTVTAVPEPETYAMMLAGLAALGFLARRRQG